MRQANILVDNTGRVRLADFGLLTVLHDLTTSHSCAQNDTIRWMSPELLNPRVQNHYPTKHSECFSLGMVIYEVLSQRVPFYPYANSTVFEKVMQGDRPERPGGVEGEWFTDVIWALLERCWVYTPQNRPSVDDVLLCLERTSRCWIPYPPAPPFATASTTGSFARRHSDKSTIVRTNWANTIKALLQLDESSPQFPQQLGGVLARSDFNEPIQSLGDNDLMLLVENLDKVLSSCYSQ